MDVYDLSFFLSTMWVGPFWFAMLFYPEHAITKKIMGGPLFFIGPIAIWWALMVSDLQVLLDFAKDSIEPDRVLASLAELLGTRAGAAAAWAHFVAGDIVVTRWMWKRCVEMGSSRWVSASSVFFGVMLMPVGVAIHLVAIRIDSKE
ncbi:MAG: abscisic acid-deficient protein Aba4 family protein [Candidatus Thermoplasmatota archaeon]|nr:abscisic acid-deficient protein Aba4 family protein [Candidatus Thermoplasmatota archaeon]